ncbi:MAG: DUF5110 domain-containing protein [Aquabacterium sp.]|nr:MAG: DUF5110 domain-containing protein [Aquabacterium sp.]
MKSPLPLLLRLLAAVLLLAAGAAQAAFVALGPAQSVAQRPNGAQFSLSGGGTLLVEFLDGGIAHVHAVPPGVTPLPTGATLAQTAATGTLTFFDSGDTVYLIQGPLAAVIKKNPLQVTIARADGSVLSADLPGGLWWDNASGTIVALKAAASGERFLGMGLAGGTLDKRGRLLWMKNTDAAAWTSQSNPLYTSTPYWLGQRDGRHYGFFLDNPAAAVFDFDSAGNGGSGQVTIAAFAGTLDYYVLAGPLPADVTRAFGKLTGNTPRPPRWALGYWQSRFGYKSAAEILSLAQTFRQLQIPCDGFFLDLDYMDRWQALSWDPSAFPDPAGFSAQMDQLGFQRVPIVEPLLSRFDRLWPWFQAQDYLLKDAAGQPVITNIFLGDVSWIDFTKTTARDFFTAQLAGFVAGSGVSGIWADLNEPAANSMPHAIYDFDGKPRYDVAARNVFALHETAAFNQALQLARPGYRPFILSRSGFAGVQRHAANWSGDAATSFDALKTSVEMSVSMGLSGQNLFGHDIGGFLGSPSAELFLRWLQFASATPFMRNHANFDTQPREPWRFGDTVSWAARKQIEWRYRLMPYFYSLYAKAESDGVPVLAPTLFHFPADTATATQNGEFMLGASLLLAPVVTEGATTRALRLPAGSAWYDTHTDTRYAGGQTVTVDAPLDRLPTFARAGSIVPMGPVRQYAAQASSDEHLMLDIFADGAGTTGAFTLVEDDGLTLAYRNGQQRSTPLAWSETASAATLGIGPATGSYPAVTRPWWLQVRGWNAAPKAVVADGTTLAQLTNPQAFGPAGGWLYDSTTKRIVIRLPGSQPAASVRIDR